MPTVHRTNSLLPFTVLFCALFLSALGAAGAQEAPPPERLFELLETARAELPADRFDFRAALDAIGSTEPTAIFEWVRDNTGYVAYRGALKGSAGALTDREGNSLDRALLLDRLLTTAGHQAVLARATLAGEALAAAAAAQRLGPRQPVPQSDAEENSARAAAELGLNQATVREWLEEERQNGAAFQEAVDSRTAVQSEALLAAIGAYPAEEAARSGVGQALDRNALLSDHWWVQVDAGGTWLDLDPTLPTAQAGDTLTGAEVRFALPELRFLAAVDGACRDLSCGDRLHRVRVAVVAESWDGKKLEEQELFATEFLTAEAARSSIVFAGQPADWPELDPFGTVDPLSDLRTELLATTAWQPTLFVNGESVGSAKIGADGKVGSAGGGGNVGAVGGLGGGLGGMFGGGSRSAAGSTEGDVGAFTALWLEYTVHTPGEGARTERRQVFDVVGPAARAAGVNELELGDAERLERALALSGQTDILISGAGIAQEALDWLAATRILNDQADWSELYHQGQQLDIAVVSARLSDTAALYAPLDLLLTLRGKSLAGYGSGAFVAAFHHRFKEDLSTSGSFDLVTGAVSSLPDSDLWFTRVTQGVRDTVLETELGAALAARSGKTERPSSVVDAYSAALAEGAAWRVVTSAEELAAAAPDLPADLAAHVRADLAMGRLALVPVGGETAVGWYSLDLRTGGLLGRGERGWGQATTEYLEGTSTVLQLRAVMNQYASMGRCLGLALTGPLRGLGSEDSDTELQECVFSTICGGVHGLVTEGFTIAGMEPTWLTVIIQNTVDSLWGGVPELGYGGMCSTLWDRLQGKAP